MRSLVIDTSTDTMVVMVLEDGRELAKVLRLGKHDHQAMMIPTIDDALTSLKLTLDDINDIIIGVGPGSYTGLRVGVMTAKMLGYTKNIQVRSISSLLLLTSGYEEKVFAWHDARNDNGFSVLLNHGKFLNEEKLRHISEVTSDELSHMVKICHDTIKLDGIVISKEAVIVEDIKALIPNYLRKTEAEVTLDQKSTHN